MPVHKKLIENGATSQFKTINDTLGHRVGNDLLKAVAQSLVEELGPVGWGRIYNPVHQAEWAWYAVRCATIQEAIKPTFILKNHYLHITTSIGISLYPQAGMNVDTLLKNADIALYRVKGLGRNTYIAILNDSDKFVGVVPCRAYPLSIGQPRGDCPYNNYANDLGLL